MNISININMNNNISINTNINIRISSIIINIYAGERGGGERQGKGWGEVGW